MKVAVVTGASSGIGLEFCRRLAEQGRHLVMVSNQPEALENCARDLAARHGVRTFAVNLDLTDPHAAERLLNYLDTQPEPLMPEILVNNAGIFSFRPVVDTPQGKIDCFLDLHIRAVTDLSRRFAQRMKEQGGGYILNMSSMACWAPMPGLALYSSTKAYIRAFTRALHYEMRDDGVKVMVACPGGIATDLFGLPPKLMKIALGLRAVQTPQTFTRNALKKLFRGRMQYINGGINRFAIVFVGVMPTRVRMLVKHLMLDKGIVR